MPNFGKKLAAQFRTMENNRNYVSMKVVTTIVRRPWIRLRKRNTSTELNGLARVCDIKWCFFATARPTNRAMVSYEASNFLRRQKAKDLRIGRGMNIVVLKQPTFKQVKESWNRHLGASGHYWKQADRLLSREKTFLSFLLSNIKPNTDCGGFVGFLFKTVIILLYHFFHFLRKGRTPCAKN